MTTPAAHLIYLSTVLAAEADRARDVRTALAAFADAIAVAENNATDALLFAPENYGNSDGNVASILNRRDYALNGALDRLTDTLRNASVEATNRILDAQDEYALCVDPQDEGDER
jgi:hypothetical protein